MPSRGEEAKIEGTSLSLSLFSRRREFGFQGVPRDECEFLRALRIKAAAPDRSPYREIIISSFPFFLFSSSNLENENEK